LETPGSLKLLLRSSYLGLIAWQFAWHALLPRPLGTHLWWLALAAALPLFFPLKGVIRVQHRGMIWGAFLANFYFMAGAMEAWSNPAQRMAASVQIALVATYLLAVILVSRRRSRTGG